MIFRRLSTMISIIVPIYKVENYLKQCLDSIIGQSFQDIEIILIDDGSPDNCPKICDEYQKLDDRIIVFHTENHGLASARNLGVEKASGDWIMFVDSDDWVEPEFCETAYKNAINHNADMVLFGISIYEIDGSINKKHMNCSGIITPQDAVKYGTNAAWNKLYHRSLFDGIRYPDGKLYEDIATTYKLVYKANRIVAINDLLYNYRLRKEGITHRNDFTKFRDHFEACIKRYDDLHSLGYKDDDLELDILEISLRFLMRIKPTDDSLYNRASEIASSFKNYDAITDVRYRNALKIWNLNPILYSNIYYDKIWNGGMN